MLHWWTRRQPCLSHSPFLEYSMPELHISRIIFVCEVYTYESYACPFQNHNWTVLFCIHKFNHLYYKSITYVLALHLIGICLDSKHCHYTYMNLFINIKILKSELSWCCRNRILPVQHIWRAGSSVLSDPIES